jgi:hypothetical protein
MHKHANPGLPARVAGFNGLKSAGGISFKHLVGACEQGRWHLEPQRSGGLQVDHEIEFRGLNDRQV